VTCELSFGHRLTTATLLMIAVICCKPKPEPSTVFTKVPSSVTNITFENTLENTDDFNIIEYLYFSIRNLPVEAQLFPIFGLCVEDIDKDGSLDVIAVGNLNAVQPDIGRYDAGYGVVLKSDGKGGFDCLSSQQSGFLVRGEGRDVASVNTSKNRKIFLVSRNNDSVNVFQQNK
jgi:hypothetical protein